MNVVIIVLIVLAVILVVGVVPMVFVTFPIAKREYINMFERDSEEKWGRENSCPENEEHSVMFDAGMEWGRAHKDVMTEVSIVNDGLNLYGEYYNFGSNRCVVILPGRAESLLYCYYFAEPYVKLGYNILVVDQRAHGNSDGEKSGVGISETGDIKAWMEHIKEKFGDEKFLIHGICIGSSTAIFLAAMHLPYLEAIVLEGPFKSFNNVLIQRTKAVGKPPYPIVWEMGYLFKKRAGINIYREKPMNYISKIKIPTLFLCGKQDYSSLPKYSVKMFERCTAEPKEIVWFDEGAHSHLRIRNVDKYDEAIENFVNKI